MPVFAMHVSVRQISRFVSLLYRICVSISELPADFMPPTESAGNESVENKTGKSDENADAKSAEKTEDGAQEEATEDAGNTEVHSLILLTRVCFVINT